MSRLQEVLERRTARSALLLRRFLGPIRLEPVPVEVGRPYYRAATAIDTLALIETPPELDGPDGGSTSLRSWRWRDSNPRP
ncbi:MAG: hypothetical protein H0W27_05850 [Actinobacteria bacterium]|nr:hypothetical protein [Actinomycetota bacterium]